MNIKFELSKIYTLTIINLIRLFSKPEKAVLYSSYSGCGYGDSLKYVDLELRRRKLKIKKYWVINEKLTPEMISEFPSDIILVKFNSYEHYKALATAKIWLTNSRNKIYCQKGKDQYYINTFHSLYPWKKVEFDVLRPENTRQYDRCIRDNENLDLILSSCKFKTSLLKETYKYEKDVLKAVLPRCDKLIASGSDTDEIQKIKERLGISTETKVLLYAPTFRNSHSVNVYDIDYELLLNALKQKFNCKWVVIVRLHPSMIDQKNKINYNETIIDGSSVSDAQELLLISNILITDYSSIMFDFMLTKRPVILYIKDIYDYQKERNFYFELESLPFFSAKSNQELADYISAYDEGAYKEKCEAYFINIGIYKRDAPTSKIIADIIEQKTANMP